MVRFQLIRMSSYANNKLQMIIQSPKISVVVAKCGDNFHKFTQYTHFYLLQKMICIDWTIYSW